MSGNIKFRIQKSAAEATSYPEGSYIFRKGDAGDTMFVVASGEVRISVDGKVVDRLTEGDLFGEMSLIDTRVPFRWWRNTFRMTTDGPNAAHVAIWSDQVLHVLCIAAWIQFIVPVL